MTDAERDEAGVAVGPGRRLDATQDRTTRPAPALADDGAQVAAREAGAEPLSTADYTVAFTPRNVAIGLAIVAGLVAIALRRRRRADGGGRDDSSRIDEAD